VIIEHYRRHLMLTSRINEGENHYFKVTIMVISVCFSWVLTLTFLTLDFV